MKTFKKDAPNGSTAKPQKTLFHFFQKQGTPSTSVEKVSCPACSLMVPKSKINWHLDYDCKSKETKGKKGRKSVGKKKTDKKMKERLKVQNKKKAMLSDSEEDDIEVLSQENGSDSDSPCLISASMVEVQMSNSEDEEQSATASQRTTTKEAVSPYFSGSSMAPRVTPSKRKEKLIDSPLLKTENKAIASLAADWDSPNTTPVKAGVSSPQNESLAGKSQHTSPGSNIVKAVTRMLDKEWTSQSVTPRKKNTKDINSNEDAESEDEFEEEVISFRTPKNSPANKKSVKTTRKSSSPCTSAGKAVKKMLEEDWEVTSPSDTPKKEVTSPKAKSNGEVKSEDEFEEEITTYRAPKNTSINGKVSDNTGSNAVNASATKSHKSVIDSVNSKLSEMYSHDEPSSSGGHENGIELCKGNSKGSDVTKNKVLNHLLDSPESSQESSQAGSLVLFSPFGSPEVVSPTRSPTPSPTRSPPPSPNTKPLNPVRKLFTPSSSPQSTPQSSPDTQWSPKKVEFSPQTKRNTYNFIRVSKFARNTGPTKRSLVSRSNSATPTKSQESHSKSPQSPSKSTTITSKGSPSKISMQSPNAVLKEEKPYKCEHCQKCFMGRDTLSTHECDHKPFECAQYGKALTSRKPFHITEAIKPEGEDITIKEEPFDPPNLAMGDIEPKEEDIDLPNLAMGDIEPKEEDITIKEEPIDLNE